VESSDLRDAANRGPESRAVASRDRMPGYGELARVLLRISLLSFGGPNAHLALTLDEVVNRAGSWSLDAVLLGRT